MRKNLRPLFSIFLSIAIAAFTLWALKTASVSAADPTPQGATGQFSTVQMLTFNGVTRTSDATGLGVLTPLYAMGDCFVTGAYQSGLANNITFDVQSSSDNSNWTSGLQPMTFVTNSTVMSRVVLYGYYTRIAATSFATTANPITGSVSCVFKNLK